MADEKPIDRPADVAPDFKSIQLEMLKKMVGGNLNQNDVVALMSLTEQNKPSGMQDMLPMMLMKRMMDSPQNQDSTTPIVLWMMMDSMRKPDGDSELNRKIDALEAKLEKREEDSKFQSVMEEIKDLKKNKENFSAKDILEIAGNKDKIIEEIKNIANKQERELLMKDFEVQMGSLVDEVKKLQGGNASIKGIADQVKSIKEIYSDLGLEKVGQKSKEEVLTNLVENTAKAFAPAVNRYVEVMGLQRQQATAEQTARLREIQAQRTPSNPGLNPESQPAEPETVDGHYVFPELVDISDSKKRRRE
jgi:hypothetical protein